MTLLMKCALIFFLLSSMNGKAVAEFIKFLPQETIEEANISLYTDTDNAGGYLVTKRRECIIDCIERVRFDLTTKFFIVSHGVLESVPLSQFRQWKGFIGGIRFNSESRVAISIIRYKI